jgi:Type ISP C-terminal specificity domain
VQFCDPNILRRDSDRSSKARLPVWVKKRPSADVQGKTALPSTADIPNPTLCERPLCAAGSTDRCNTFCKLLSWGLIEQGLSGPFVELPRDCAEFGLAMQGQISATRKILAQQSVGVFVWTYKLGNRSALEWILDQYKEKTPKDPTIQAKFNTYRFADHKEKVIDLLMRVTRVSVETMEIVEAMKSEKR